MTPVEPSMLKPLEGLTVNAPGVVPVMVGDKVPAVETHNAPEYATLVCVP